MCESGATENAAASAPRPAEGTAVDPITLPAVDEVRITTLVDNVYDGLLADEPGIRRGPMSAGLEPAPQFEDAATMLGMRAEHGFSVLLRVRSGNRTSALIFDAGLSPDAMVVNADRLGVDFGDIGAVVLSHGHFDHTGGLVGLAQRMSPARMPMVVHPGAWTRRRLSMVGGHLDLPTLSPRALRAEGFDVIERAQPSLVLDGHVLVTGEVDRTTEFEHGMPPAHQAWDGEHWVHDATVIDDQALVINVAGRGLVVVTGCGHAGVVNIVRHAQRLTGIEKVSAVIGGFHLSGPSFEPVIAPTVDAFQEWEPDLLVPGHCTGWKAQHALAARFPDAFAQGSSGSGYTLTAGAA